MAEHVIIAELDEHVAAVWQTILMGQAHWLVRRILNYELTVDNVRRTLAQSGRSNLAIREKAFLAILRNRVQRGGIMAPGAGLVKMGENNKGIRSRWYPETLARRIGDIAAQREHISFYFGDGFRLLREWAFEPRAVFFVDPPYTKAARRLYNNWDINHRELFRVLEGVRGSFLVTYDYSEEVRRLAEEFGFQWRWVRMKNTHHAEMKELLIAKQFDWFDAIEE